jgi:hypothetical protein
MVSKAREKMPGGSFAVSITGNTPYVSKIDYNLKFSYYGARYGSYKA